MFLLEMRRSPAAWAFPALVAVDVSALWSKRDMWDSSWQTVSMGIQLPVILLAPLLAGVAAYAGGREARSGFNEIAGGVPRSSLHRALTGYTPLVLFGLLAYLAGACVATLTAVLVGVTGVPGFSYIASGALVLLATSALGYAAGCTFRGRFLAPSVAVAVYAAPAAGTYLGRNALGNLMPRFQVADTPSLRPRQDLLVAQYAWCLALIVHAMTVATLSKSSRPRYKPLLTIGVLPAALAGGFILITPPTPTEARPPASPVCASAAPRLCVWPEHANALPRLASVVPRYVRALHGVVEFPDTIYEPDLAGAQMNVNPSYGYPKSRLTIRE